MELLYKLVYSGIGILFLISYLIYEFSVKIVFIQILIVVSVLLIFFGFLIYQLIKKSQFRNVSISPKNDLSIIADKYGRDFYEMKTKVILSEDWLTISKRFFGYYCYSFLYRKVKTSEHLEKAIIIIIQFDDNDKPSIGYIRDDLTLSYFMKHKSISQDRFEEIWQLYSPFYKGAPTDKIKPEDELITRLKTPVKKYKISKKTKPNIMKEVSPDEEKEEDAEETEIEESEK